MEHLFAPNRPVAFCVGVGMLVYSLIFTNTCFAQNLDITSDTTFINMATSKNDTLNNKYVFSLGYSFGRTNSPLNVEKSINSGNQRDSAPLLALYAELNRYHRVGGSVRLALANFGRLTKFLSADPSDPSTTTDDSLGTVRRSIIAEFDVHTRFGNADKSSFMLLLNTGFIFDAQGDDNAGSVADASSYFFLGAAIETSFRNGSQLRVDALIGQSEVMTDIELFSKAWSKKDVIRFRPKIRFLLKDKIFKKNPVILGLSADLGVSDKFGDTYVVFLSRLFGGS